MNAIPKKITAGHLASPPELALGLQGMLAYRKFPGRTSLTVNEVAIGLGVTAKHVIHLIEAGLLGAIEVVTGARNQSSREHWRVPVGAYDDYIRRRSNTTEGKREGLRTADRRAAQ